jgi:hypothetical protein
MKGQQQQQQQPSAAASIIRKGSAYSRAQHFVDSPPHTPCLYTVVPQGPMTTLVPLPGGLLWYTLLISVLIYHFPGL